MEERKEEAMGRGKDAKAYLALLLEIEANKERDLTFYSRFEEEINHILPRKQVAEFLSVTRMLHETPGKNVLPRQANLVRVLGIAEALEQEKATGFLPFFHDTETLDQLMDKYQRVNLLLRRIEFEISAQETMAEIRKERISPYAAAAVLYNYISLLGHRENILLTLASGEMEEGDYVRAYGFLSVIRNPSEEARKLREELSFSLCGAGHRREQGRG